jgi:hypothetical protein
MKQDRWRRTRPLAPASSPDGRATYVGVTTTSVTSAPESSMTDREGAKWPDTVELPASLQTCTP